MPDDAKLETGSPAEMIAILDRLSSPALRFHSNNSYARAIRWAARIAEAASDPVLVEELKAHAEKMQGMIFLSEQSKDKIRHIEKRNAINDLIRAVASASEEFPSNRKD